MCVHACSHSHETCNSALNVCLWASTEHMSLIVDKSAAEVRSFVTQYWLLILACRLDICNDGHPCGMQADLVTEHTSVATCEDEPAVMSESLVCDSLLFQLAGEPFMGATEEDACSSSQASNRSVISQNPLFATDTAVASATVSHDADLMSQSQALLSSSDNPLFCTDPSPIAATTHVPAATELVNLNCAAPSSPAAAAVLSSDLYASPLSNVAHQAFPDAAPLSRVHSMSALDFAASAPSLTIADADLALELARVSPVWPKVVSREANMAQSPAESPTVSKHPAQASSQPDMACLVAAAPLSLRSLLLIPPHTDFVSASSCDLPESQTGAYPHSRLCFAFFFL